MDWTAITCATMLALGKARTDATLDDPVLKTAGRGTLVDGYMADAVLVGLVVNASGQTLLTFCRSLAV